MTGSPALPAPAEPRRGRGRSPLAAVPAVPLAAVPLAGAARAPEADLCLLAAQDAARLSGAPLSVLVGIALTETRRGEGVATRPWPVDMEGGGHWFATRDEAPAFAQAHRAAGATSLDVGCFQVDWRWHGENFTGLPQMFGPLANASYAARFLKDPHAETGDWSAAAGACRSRSPEHATRHRGTFGAHRAAAVAVGADQGRLDVGAPLPEAAVPRANTFPLLTGPAGAPRLGSLAPIDG